ncbi:MAG: phosphoribosylamine--glycine ligase [Dehalococcoidia bacterium]
MRVLVVGNGGREHAMLWKLAGSPRRPELFAAPGNAGTSALATNLDVQANDVDGVLKAAHEHRIDLTIVGPEGPLAAGIVDRFHAEGMRVFGPTKAAAQIESSKVFSKQLMRSAGVPTADFEVFDDAGAAKAYVRRQGAPIVIKADGLAAGKGVVVAKSVEEALAALEDMMVHRVFGGSGNRVVLEACLSGQEVSVFCFTDGQRVTPLVAACDYKRAYDSDGGPNTGGMGGYSPPPFWNPELERALRATCIEPVVHEMARSGTPYTGVLYGGLMLTDKGPYVIEFNARFGDPEAQLVLPRLETDLLDVVDAVIDGKVDQLGLQWSRDTTVGVVLASGGYPGHYETGKPIAGLDQAAGAEDSLVFHAGTAARAGGVVTTGGRVLTVVGRGAEAPEARALAYEAAARITFAGKHYRQDIASFAS